MDHARLNTAIARLALVATEDVPPRVTLRELCDAASDALPVQGVGVMVTDENMNRFVHATTEAAADLERIQEALRSGPCRDAATSGRAVQAHGRSQLAAWPEFARIAAQVGIGSVVAIPLVSRGRTWGVLDLFTSDEVALEEDVLASARLLADVATGYMVTAHDRDAARDAREQMLHESTHDQLTGAANRVRLFDRLEHALDLAPRRGTAVGVAFIDVVGFKQVNDTFGHRAGDRVLQEVSRRLSALLRAGDTLGRLGGDEFVVVFDELAVDTQGEPAGAIGVIAERIRVALLPGIDIGADQATVTITVSIGAAVTTGGMTAGDLISEADEAMYRSKTHPTDHPEIRDYTGNRARRDARAIERDLGRALERDQLEVHYQPIVDANPPHRVVAAEALMRWRDSDGVLHPAVEFIDTAVERGLMPSFGSWLIDQVCAQMGAWTTRFGTDAPLRLFINLSARELNDPALPAVLASAAERHGLEPNRLGLEIVEDNFVHPTLLARLNQLREQGHALSIDDFGTGYSSLSRLFDLRVDVAKIDRHFVQGVPADARRRGFIEAVLSVTRSLEIDVIAEGVENTSQQQYLQQAGTSQLQGYLFGHPEPAENLTTRLIAQVDRAT